MTLSTTLTTVAAVAAIIVVTLVASAILKRRVGDNLANLISQLVPVLVLTAVVVGILLILDPDQAQTLLDATIKFVPRALVAVLVIIIARSLGKIAGLFAETAIRRISPTVARQVSLAISSVLLGVGVIIALDQLGVSTQIILLLTAAIAFGGALAAALAIGLGTVPLARQVVAGRYVGNRFRPGQLIRIGDTEGRLLSVGLSSCVLETAGGDRFEVPNQAFLEGGVLVLPD